MAESFEKRQRERKKREKRAEKSARRRNRSEEKQTGESGPNVYSTDGYDLPENWTKGEEPKDGERPEPKRGA